MGEDQSRVRAGHAAQNLGTLRQLALNLLKREKTKKRGIKGKQKNAAGITVTCLNFWASRFRCVCPGLPLEPVIRPGPDHRARGSRWTNNLVENQIRPKLNVLVGTTHTFLNMDSNCLFSAGTEIANLARGL